VSDALLDTLRALAQRQSERAAQNGGFSQSVEHNYERNEKTRQQVECVDLVTVAATPEESRLSNDQRAEAAEILGPHRPAPRDPSYEKNEIYEKTPSCRSDVPPEWNDGLARLHPGRPPGDVPSGRWRQFINDCGRLLGAGLIEEAARLGWTAHDLFACNDRNPFARLDQMGLVWFIKGGRVISMSMSAAVIETPTGARQTYRRKDGTLGQVLVWELA
jgi:hypothetical protein